MLISLFIKNKIRKIIINEHNMHDPSNTNGLPGLGIGTRVTAVMIRLMSYRGKRASVDVLIHRLNKTEQYLFTALVYNNRRLVKVKTYFTVIITITFKYCTISQNTSLVAPNNRENLIIIMYLLNLNDYFYYHYEK